MSFKETFEGFCLSKNMKRPICKICNKNHCAINYRRNGETHYRSMCDDCRKGRPKNKPRIHGWERVGYAKKPHCDLCGFKALYPSQITVFHVDGNLENLAFNNLRSICLNCVEVVKKKEVTWKRGDLQVDR